MNCFSCGCHNLRLSRIHWFDLKHIFLLRIPVRCRYCHKRMYAKIFLAWGVIFAGMAGRKRAPKADSNPGGDSAAA